MSERSLDDYLATPTLTDLERDAIRRRFTLDHTVARIAHELGVRFGRTIDEAAASILASLRTPPVPHNGEDDA